MLDFVDAGHDLLLAVDSNASDELRELATDLGVDFDTKGSVVTDHFNRHDQQHAGIITSNALDSRTIFGSSHKHVSIRRPVLYALASLSDVARCNMLDASAGPGDIQRDRSIHLAQKHTGKQAATYTSVFNHQQFLLCCCYCATRLCQIRSPSILNKDVHTHQYLPCATAVCKAMQKLSHTMYHANMYACANPVDNVLLLRL